MNRYDQELEDVLQAERIKRARSRKHRCQQRGCVYGARVILRDWQGKDWRFCDRHGRARSAHDRVVERILRIPAR